MARREDRKDKPPRQTKEEPLSLEKRKEKMREEIRRKFREAFGFEDIGQGRRQQ